MIRQDLRTYLAGFAGLAALVSTGDKSRIYLSRVPQSDTPFDNFPAIVYRRASGGHEHDLDGSAGYAAALFEFHVIARDSPTVEAVCEQLRLALQGFRGVIGDGDSDVRRATLDDESDDYIESDIGDDVGFHRTVLKYTIGYVEPIPTFS